MLSAHQVSEAFTALECQQIIAIAHQESLREAGLVGNQSNHNVRRAEIAWLDERAGAEWVMDRILSVVAKANRDAFGFDLSEFAESPQVARYGAERAGHFGWHSDIGDGPVARKRKLTMVVQLSEPGAYDGGVLELRPDIAVSEVPRAVGSAVLFPAFVLHQVTPVTRGERHSLTIWAHGPAFR